MIDRFAITSPDLAPRGRLGAEFSADGENRTPRIHIAGAPESAVELALICHDPDAPRPRGFTHWVVYGIDPRTEEVDLDDPRVRLGPNGLGRQGWFGPRPPLGHGVHHYYFWVYALSRRVEGEPDRETFLDEYGAAIVAQERLVGTYSRW